MIRFFWIDIHYACFGLESRDGVVTRTAPIAGWMTGRTLVSIRGWLIKRKAKVIELDISDSG